MTTTQTSIVAIIFVIVATRGCLAGYERTGLLLSYAIAWLVFLDAILHWYARRRDILWFTPKR